MEYSGTEANNTLLGEKKRIPGRQFQMGDDAERGFKPDLEGPPKTVTLKPFWMKTTTVTVSEFSHFVQETGYQTDAERYGWSYVFYLLVEEEKRKYYPAMPGMNWWLVIEGANWKQPEGPNSGVEDRMNHPVTHVSWNDAQAYCKWSGQRLPTEAEWEFAARGGREDSLYPWGDELLKDGAHQCNIWQGEFPLNNTVEDGFLGTAPVYSYEPNGYGLYQMAGNVWEWCLNPAKISLETFQEVSSEEFYEQNQKYSSENYAMKGGSFLCHCSYCNRYRVAARNGNTADSSSSNVGFRCVKDV